MRRYAPRADWSHPFFLVFSLWFVVVGVLWVVCSLGVRGVVGCFAWWLGVLARFFWVLRGFCVLGCEVSVRWLSLPC